MKDWNITKNKLQHIYFFDQGIILYRVKTCYWDSKTFRNIYYLELFAIMDSGSSLWGYITNFCIEHLEEHDQ